MIYFHAYATARINNRQYYWEVIKDKSGYRELHNPDVDAKIPFAPYLAQLDTPIDVPANTKATYNITIWGIDGTTKINASDCNSVITGDNASRIALRQIISDSDFASFLQLTTRLPAPKNVRLRANGSPSPGDRLLIEWDAVPGAYGYYQYTRVHGSGAAFEGFPMGVVDTQTSIIYLRPGTTYDLYVVADDGHGNLSYPSEILTAKTQTM